MPRSLVYVILNIQTNSEYSIWNNILLPGQDGKTPVQENILCIQDTAVPVFFCVFWEEIARRNFQPLLRFVFDPLDKGWLETPG